MVSKRQRGERLVAVSIVGLLALNYPLLDLFNRVALVFGVPLLYVYLFLAWALLIAVMAMVLERKAPGDASNPSPPTRSGD